MLEKIEIIKKYITENKKKSIIAIVLILIAIVCLCTIIYICIDRKRSSMANEQLKDEIVQESTDETDDSDVWYNKCEVDLEEVQKENSDIVGWLYFEDEDISYPILYSSDGKYLSKNYLGEDAREGSIYIEPQNKSDFSDAHTLIYGHNMKNLSMFGKLKYYKTKDGYYDDHRYFQIITNDKKYRYEIFAYKDVNVLTGGVYTIFNDADDDFRSFVKNTLAAGRYNDSDLDLTQGDSVITFSTCTGKDDTRFVVSAICIEQQDR